MRRIPRIYIIIKKRGLDHVKPVSGLSDYDIISMKKALRRQKPKISKDRNYYIFEFDSRDRAEEWVIPHFKKLGITKWKIEEF